MSGSIRGEAVVITNASSRPGAAPARLFAVPDAGVMPSAQRINHIQSLARAIKQVQINEQYVLNLH